MSGITPNQQQLKDACVTARQEVEQAWDRGASGEDMAIVIRDFFVRSISQTSFGLHPLSKGQLTKRRSGLAKPMLSLAATLATLCGMSLLVEKPKDVSARCILGLQGPANVHLGLHSNVTAWQSGCVAYLRDEITSTAPVW
jgi:hypothetical protein